MLKNRTFKFLSVFCSVVIGMSTLTFSTVRADEIVGKMSSVYAYVLNDYLYEYGVMHTEEAGDTIRRDEDGLFEPSGVIYSEVVNFDANENPYLVIFLANSAEETASCHIWRYDEESESAEKIASFDENYLLVPEGSSGVFSLCDYGDKRYVTYAIYDGGAPIYEDYYTAIDGEAYKYVNTPPIANEVGVMDFNENYFHPGVDVSYYNENIDNFFDSLKNAAADSVTYEDIAEHLSDEDEAQIEAVLKNAVSFTNFDIADYSSMDEYRTALDIQPNGDRFYLISEAYNLGDEIYYIRFSTDRSYYNYALLRRSDDAENGYQILKVRTDCIPLSDRELKQIKAEYDKNTLLYKKSKGSLKLAKESKYDSPQPCPTKEPIVAIDKFIDRSLRLPAVCIGGGISLALLTLLWVYIYSDND